MFPLFDTRYALTRRHVRRRLTKGHAMLILSAFAFMTGVGLVVSFNVRILPLAAVAALLCAVVMSTAGIASLGTAVLGALLVATLLQVGYVTGAIGVALARRQATVEDAVPAAARAPFVSLLRRISRD